MKMLEKSSGIYCYENLINSKKYVGQAQDFDNREKVHLYFLNNKKYNDSKYFQNAWNKYGKENFKFYIVEKCSIELLEEKEKYWIKELHSHYTEWGYNISWGGKAFMRGRKHTLESIQKMSLIQIGEKNSMYGKTAEKNPFYGKHHSEESIQKMIINQPDRYGENNSFFGRKHSFKTIKKILESKKKNKCGNNSSKYVGVYYRKDNKKFTAQIRAMGKRYNLGAFLTEQDAAIAYNLKVRELYGIDYDINKIE